MRKENHYFALPFMKKRRAFTLIELMIAMAIIAILATAGMQAYNGYIKKSRDAARAEIAQNLNTAVASYAASNDGNPPASAAAFDEFLANAGSTFGVSSSLTASGRLVEDPVGGKDVCLDAEGHNNQPCVFHYTAYADGTYAISYGVESESSTRKNFYKTTDSVVAVTETVQEDVGDQTPVPKYGVYTGTARYIGQESTTSNFQTGYTTHIDGVDQLYTPPGSGGTVVALVPVFRSITMNTVVSGGGGGGGGGGGSGRGTALEGEECTLTLDCATGWCVYDSRTGNGGALRPLCSSNPLFGICLNDAECGGGLICTNNGCTDGALGSPCWYSNDCDNGYYCARTASGTNAYTCTDGQIGALCGDSSGCDVGLQCSCETNNNCNGYGEHTCISV